MGRKKRPIEKNKRRFFDPKAKARTIETLDQSLREKYQKVIQHFELALNGRSLDLYCKALNSLETCRNVLKSLIFHKSDRQQLGSQSSIQDPHVPDGKSDSLRAGRVPVGKGFVIRGQGQTRRPGSRKSQG